MSSTDSNPDSNAAKMPSLAEGASKMDFLVYQAKMQAYLTMKKCELALTGEAILPDESEVTTDAAKLLQGKPWKLIITKPEKVAGTPAELVFECFPPIGFENEYITVNDLHSPAYSFGNIHEFKGSSSEEDAEMKFTTKWKVCGHRYTGTLSVQVKPSDKADEKQKEDEPLMVVGKFGSGLKGQGVNSWSFKGYRD